MISDLDRRDSDKVALVVVGTSSITQALWFGTDGNDTYNGGTDADTLYGAGGNDLVSGGGGKDAVFAGDGNDTVSGEDGGDAIYGNAGNDSLSGHAGDDAVFAGDGNDTVNGDDGGDAIYGDAGNDSLSGQAGDDVIFGGDGGDSLTGGAGADTLWGGAGNDSYVIDGADDQISELGDEGVDTILSSVSYVLSSFSVENLTLTGTANLSGTGDSLNNAVTGNTGNNRLDGGAGVDTLDGGLGDDTYYVDHVSDKVVETTAQGTDTVLSSVSYSLNGRAVEILILTGTAHLSAIGNALGNGLNGNAGNNLLDGGAGSDSMAGGAGNDTYIIDAVGDLVTELVGEGLDEVRASRTWVLSDNVENLVLIGTGAMNGTGNGLNNRLTGNNTTNVLTGGLGNDTYYVQNTSDSVVEAAGEGTDAVVASISWTLGADVENLTLTGTANLTGTGNALNNVLTGNAGNNILRGGQGNDVYNIQNAGDSVQENHLEGTDQIISTVSYSLAGRAVEILILQGTADLNATGNGLVNSLIGNVGANILDAGAGMDNLRGNGGADVFLFLAGSGKDAIKDFTAADNDIINVHAYTIGSANEAMVVQKGGNVVITLSASNIITVENALRADVLSHMVW